MTSLTERERVLIRAAETQLWNEDLREMLAIAVSRRGGYVSARENCGELVDLLEMLADAP